MAGAGSSGAGVWPDAWGHAGCGVILAALPIWAPLPLLTSRLVLCHCRLAGARSYWCHCHCLPPGYICACGLGHHHTEKVLRLLNSIKDFSVTQPACLQPSTAPELSAWGPGRNGATDTGKTLQAPVLGSQAAPSAHHLWCVCVYIFWVTQTWQGLSTPLRRGACGSIRGFELGGPSGSSLVDGNSVGHHPAQLS